MNFHSCFPKLISNVYGLFYFCDVRSRNVPPYPYCFMENKILILLIIINSTGLPSYQGQGYKI